MLWDLLVNKLHVRPHLFCYASRSKAPVAAAKCIKDIGLVDAPRTGAMHLQPLLGIYHPHPEAADKKRLTRCLVRAEMSI